MGTAIYAAAQAASLAGGRNDGEGGRDSAGRRGRRRRDRGRGARRPTRRRCLMTVHRRAATGRLSATTADRPGDRPAETGKHAASKPAGGQVRRGCLRGLPAQAGTRGGPRDVAARSRRGASMVRDARAGPGRAVPAALVFGALRAERQLTERTADLQRLQAEYANYRKRVDRDRATVRSRPGQPTLRAAPSARCH